MKINKTFIKIALKFIKKKELEEMAKLSEDDFCQKVRNNPKTKDFSDDFIKMMYKELIKKANKK